MMIPQFYGIGMKQLTQIIEAINEFSEKQILFFLLFSEKE